MRLLELDNVLKFSMLNIDMLETIGDLQFFSF